MAETFRFYTDEHSAMAVAKGLRRRGIGVMTTYEAGRLGTSDEEQPAFAAMEDRVFFTKDDDFLRLHATGITHAGIVYAQQGTRVGDIIRGLTLVFEVYGAAEMRNHVEFL